MNILRILRVLQFVTLTMDYNDNPNCITNAITEYSTKNPEHQIYDFTFSIDNGKCIIVIRFYQFKHLQL